MAILTCGLRNFSSVLFLYLLTYVSCILGNLREEHVTSGDVINQIQPGRIYKIRDSLETNNAEKELTILCWSGEPKTPLTIWKSATINVNIEGEDFIIYVGENITHVKHLHKILQESWFSFLPWKEKTVSVSPFNASCTGIFTSQDFNIRLDLRQLNFNRLVIFFAGLILFIISPTVCEKAIFHYTTGTLIGVLGSILIIVYLTSRLFPKKGSAVAVMVGGSSIVLFILRSLWENCYAILRQYHYYVVGYLVASSVISFGVCYRFGPLTDTRSLHLLQWALQAIGLVLIFVSSEYKEAVVGIIIVLLCVHNFPRPWIYHLTGLWRKRFPPKVRLLTDDEYFEQGRQETKKALDDLRVFCKSPQCDAWKTVGRLKEPFRSRRSNIVSSPKRNCVEFVSPSKPEINRNKRRSRSSRFAEFVEGKSHLSDREVLDYETETVLPDDGTTWTDDESEDD